MVLSSLSLLFVAQAAPVAVQAPPPGYDPYLEGYLANESVFAQRLAQVSGDDLRAEWLKYVEKEREKAVDRAEDYAKGEVDRDKAPIPFAEYLDDRHRKRRNVGIGLFAGGFAPLGFGLYTGLTLGEGTNGALGIAAFGGAVVVAGAVVWGVFGARLGRFRRDRDTARGLLQARVQWRGVAPLVSPQTRTHGLSVGFAF